MVLVERGVKPGDVVAMMLPSGIDYAVAFAAIAWAGAVSTGLNTRLGKQEVEGVLRQADPVLVIRDNAAGLPPARRLTVGDLVKRVSAETGENIQVRRFVRFHMGTA